MNNTTTIKGFCDFVNYLYDNKNAFAKYNNIVAKMQNIINESSQLQPKKYADDRKQNEALQEQYKEYYSIIEGNVILPIKEKGRELAGLLFEYEDKNRLQEAFNEIADLTKQNIESISICIDKFFDFTSDFKIVGFGLSFTDFEDMIKELYAKIKNNPYGIKPKHKPIFNENTITSPPSPISPPFTAKKIIDIYDPVKVHKEFRKELNCTYETFKAWFVDSVVCDKKMSWKYDKGNKTQLRSFIYNLCEGWTPKETNTAFIKISVDSNIRDTQINNDLLQRLEKCRKD